MPLTPLTAISPLDGRYRAQLERLGDLASELGLMRLRTRIEIAWFLHLADAKEIPELPAPAKSDRAFLQALADDFDESAAARIKDIERTTNHDVKAVEYYVKERLGTRPALQKHVEFVHFGCTSEDINNLAHALMLRAVRDELVVPAMDALIDAIATLAERHADAVMLSRTHGQAASPTTMGKEMANFGYRMRRQREQLLAVRLLGKMNGAVGNYNAHRAAYPRVDWPALAQRFVESLGLEHNPYTTQIEPHDYIAELFHALSRFNTILLDFDRDVWGYVAIDYFRSRPVAGEVGSSTMPHKVNPIDFENSEGNLGVANALLAHLAEKLPVSRWQRDLSDSTALRNVGTAIGHTLVAYQSTLKGIAKLELDRGALDRDLGKNFEVLAEAVQTMMRKHGMDSPYEALKAATRGERLDAAGYARLLDALPLPDAVRRDLAKLTPHDYAGLAESLAKRVRETPPERSR